MSTFSVSLNLDNGATSAQLFIGYALEIGALQLLKEPRKLKSGRLSPYFFNSALFNTGRSLSNLIDAYLAAIPIDMKFDVIYGPAYKGIVLASTMAENLWVESGVDCGYAHNRKEAKDHGEGGNLVGHGMGQKRILLVDDVMTSGASCDEAVTRIKEQQGELVGCVIAFDRQEYTPDDPVNRLSATQAFTEKHSVPVWSAATFADLISTLDRYGEEETEDFADMMDNLHAYRLQYGARM